MWRRRRSAEPANLALVKSLAVIRFAKKSGGEGEIARGRGRPLVLRYAPDRRARPRRPKIAPRFLSNLKVRTPPIQAAPKIKKGHKSPFLIFASGGEGEIRTHVPELPDHPISSRRRYDHFGTSPVNLKFDRIYLSYNGVNLRLFAV